MKKIFVLFLVFCILSFPKIVYGDTNNTENYNYNEVQQLYNYMSNVKTKYELLEELNIEDYVQNVMKTGDGKFDVNKLLKALLDYSIKDIIAGVKLMTMLIIVCVVCALLVNLERAFSNEKLSGIAYFACYSLIIIIVAKAFNVGVEEVKNTINGLRDFMVAIMPVLLGLLLSSGAAIEATVVDPIIMVTISVVSQLYASVILPLIMVSFALEFVNNISNDYKVEKLAKLLKQSVMWLQGLAMTIFIAVVTIRGISAKAMDEVTAKTAKFAVDNFVPIVGKCLSDAISSVVGYSALIKNALSSVGLIIIIGIVTLPIIKVFIIAFIHKFTAAIVEPISDKRIVNVINSAGDTLILLAASLISITVMFFIIIGIIAACGNNIS